MTWYYEFNREQRGPVNEEELDRLIAQGQVLPATLVWREGMAAWTPLEQARTSVSGMAAEGAVVCDSCGRAVSPEEVIELGGRNICAACKPVVLQKLQQGGDLSNLSDAARTGPDWEERQTLGTFAAAMGTIKSVLTRPSETFASMRCTGGIGSPFLYFLLVGGLGMAAYLFYFIIAMYLLGSSFQGTPGMPRQNPFANLGNMPATAVVTTVLTMVISSFIQTIVGVFLQSGILHLCLMVCGGARKTFETTFRVVAYGNGSVLALMAIPVLGLIVAIPWFLVVNCIGLAKAHETDLWRGVLAAFLPMLVCCGGAFAIIMLAGVGGALSR